MNQNTRPRKPSKIPVLVARFVKSPQESQEVIYELSEHESPPTLPLEPPVLRAENFTIQELAGALSDSLPHFEAPVDRAEEEVYEEVMTSVPDGNTEQCSPVTLFEKLVDYVEMIAVHEETLEDQNQPRTLKSFEILEVDTTVKEEKAELAEYHETQSPDGSSDVEPAEDVDQAVMFTDDEPFHRAETYHYNVAGIVLISVMVLFHVVCMFYIGVIPRILRALLMLFASNLFD